MESNRKKIKFKVIDFQTLSLELVENANIGDYIVINDSENVEIVNQINEYFKSLNQKELLRNYNDFRKKGFEEFKMTDEWINLNKNYFAEKNQVEILKNKIEDLKIKAINEFKLSKEYTDLNFEINNLKNQLNNFKNNQERENEHQKKLFQTEADKKILKTTFENEKKLKEELEKKLKDELLINDNKWKEIEKQKNLEIESIRNEYERLSNFRFNANSKLIGEELEKWVYEELNSNFGLNENYSFEKDNDTSKTGTKADFIFCIKDYNDSKKTISTITVECKSQSDNTEKGKKNNDSGIIKQILKNAFKNNSQYAVLVSNLEPTSNFTIIYQHHNEKCYKNIKIFTVRPEYLKTILLLLENIERKRNSLELKFSGIEKYENEIVKNLLDQFYNLKEEILTKNFDDLNKDSEKILSFTEKIRTNVDNIEEQIKFKINKHVQEIKNKLEKFNPIIKKIDKKILKEDKTFTKNF